MSNTNTNNELISIIKEYITCCSEIIKINMVLKKHKETKKVLTDKLIQLMEKSDTDCLDTNNQQIIYKINKVKQPINSKYLNKILADYFENTSNIDINHLNSYINENRSITQKPVLFLKYK